jgi:hypothetical protein
MEFFLNLILELILLNDELKTCKVQYIFVFYFTFKNNNKKGILNQDLYKCYISFERSHRLNYLIIF